MTDRPVVDRYAEELYRALLPVAHADEINDWALLHLCQAIAVPHDTIDALSLDGIGWSTAVDLDRCPDDWLPWLGQFWGVKVAAHASPEQQRDQIRDAAGMRRGTLGSIIGAAKLALTGNKTVRVTERDGGAYRLTITTYSSETPDAAAVVREVTKVKPAGLIPNFEVRTGWTYDEERDFYALTGGTYNDEAAGFADYDQLRDRIPS